MATFVRSNFIVLCLFLVLSVNAANGTFGTEGFSTASQIRLVWVDDPATTITVGWSHSGGADATVHYGATDEGRNASAYPFAESVDRTAAYSGGEIVSKFARLSNLKPDTVYFFVLSDDTGVSPRYYFRTASDAQRAFSFIAGGDSRNNRVPRQNANRMVAKLRPLFVAFTGDMINRDNATEWNEWLADWQLTVSDDGQMYPILPHRGNHEGRGNDTISDLFDTTPSNYYALTFGDGLLRYYVLNSEYGEAAQADWMQADLEASGGAGAFTHLLAGYHKPMRPHTSGKTEGRSEYDAWAQLFYENRFDLVFESDSHVMKRTRPLRPSVEEGHDEGFVIDEEHGTVYVGEGCWGAPLRTVDDSKSWTLDSGSFNGFDLVHVYPEHMEVFTVQVDSAAESSALPPGGRVLSLPANLPLWEANGGARLVVARTPDIPLSYSRYQMEVFPEKGVPAGSGYFGDYEADGIENQFEFAFVLDPTVAESMSVASFRLPHFTLRPDGGKELAFRKRTGSTLRYRIEISSDINSWETLVESVDFTLSSNSGNGYDDVTYEMLGDAARRDRAFFRVIAEE